MATWNRLTVAAPANQYDNQMKMLDISPCFRLKGNFRSCPCFYAMNHKAKQ
jgi:hypothetical protein